MAESITLQTSDSNVQQSDVLGRLSFAASNESNTSDARLIGATIHAEAEGEFTEISNPTSIIFSTASSESATSKLKITSSGHFLPISNKSYDIGSIALKFRNIYSETNYPDKIVLTSGSQPSSTENTLYNLSGILHYDTKAVALLPSGGLQNQILQKVSDTSYDLQWINNFATEVNVYVKNITGSGLLKGQAVYINGAQGDHPTITLAQASSESTSSKTLGLLKQDLANNEFGYVISEGILTSVNTNSAGSAGDSIWLSPSIPGGLVYGLANKPSAPDHMVFIGYVLRKQLNEGIIYIKPQNGFEIEELHDVRIKSLNNNDILTYNSSSGVWANTTNPSGSLNNSIIAVSGMFVSGSGALNGGISTNATNITTVSGMFVSGSGALNNYISTHTHTSSQITDFNSSVSGLLPVKNIVAGSNITITSSSGTFTINSSSSGSASSGVLEYPTVASFPSSGTSSTIYISTDYSRMYRWNGSSYNEMGSLGGDASFSNLFLPPAPTDLTGAAGFNKVDLTWVAPSATYIPTITDYIIQYSSNSGSTWTTFNDGVSAATSGSVTGLINGSGYVFKVAAINPVGTGTYSSNSITLTPAGDTYWANVSLLAHANGTGSSFTDSSVNNLTITANGSVTQSATQSKFGGKSAYFDQSTNSYLSVANNSVFDFGTGPFTVEMWFYPLAFTVGGNATSLMAKNGNDNWANAWGFDMDATNLSFYIGPSPTDCGGAHGMTTGQWYHIAATRDSSNFCRLFVNGVQKGAGGTVSTNLTNTNILTIGSRQISSSYAYRLIGGYLDDIRITKGIARYVSNFTIPSAEFTNG